MKNTPGSYFRSSAFDKWHWIKECPGFPLFERIENRLSPVPPAAAEVCPICLKLEEQTIPIETIKRSDILHV